jgi:hypothetical protein
MTIESKTDFIRSRAIQIFIGRAGMSTQEFSIPYADELSQYSIEMAKEFAVKLEEAGYVTFEEGK